MSYQNVAILSQVVSTPLFLLVLLWIWIKWIGPGVLAAQESHNQQIALAERHRDEAKAALDALRHEIDGARHDAELIAKRASDQAAREREANILQANEASERAFRNAQGELARARAAASERLRTELLNKALATAEQEAAQRVNAALNDTLVDRFIASLETAQTRG